MKSSSEFPSKIKYKYYVLSQLYPDSFKKLPHFKQYQEPVSLPLSMRKIEEIRIGTYSNNSKKESDKQQKKEKSEKKPKSPIRSPAKKKQVPVHSETLANSKKGGKIKSSSQNSDSDDYELPQDSAWLFSMSNKQTQNQEASISYTNPKEKEKQFSQQVQHKILGEITQQPARKSQHVSKESSQESDIQPACVFGSLNSAKKSEVERDGIPGEKRDKEQTNLVARLKDQFRMNIGRSFMEEQGNDDELEEQEDDQINEMRKQIQNLKEELRAYQKKREQEKKQYEILENSLKRIEQERENDQAILKKIKEQMKKYEDKCQKLVQEVQEIRKQIKIKTEAAMQLNLQVSNLGQKLFEKEKGLLKKEQQKKTSQK